MKHASLFSGIGGFDLAAEWVGWTNVFNCEIDKFCQKVLRYHFPNAIQYEDIKSTDFAIHRGGVDVLTGGFPCQPFSLAGKRRGSDDNRYLWPEMLRAIREIQPRWVVGENVFGIVNWSDGMVFEQVQSDLEAEGYEVQPFLIPACAVDAPHRRDRVWFIARKRNVTDCCDAGFEVLQREGAVGIYADRDVTDAVCERLEGKNESGCQEKAVREHIRRYPSRHNLSSVSSDSMRQRGRERAKEVESKFAKRDWVNGVSDERCDSRVQYWTSFPTQSPVCGRDDGLSARLDGITLPRWRRESIKAYGNAVVPQVVLQIFETIKEYDNEIQTEIPDTR